MTKNERAAMYLDAAEVLAIRGVRGVYGMCYGVAGAAGYRIAGQDARERCLRRDYVDLGVGRWKADEDGYLPLTNAERIDILHLMASALCAEEHLE